MIKQKQFILQEAAKLKKDIFRIASTKLSSRLIVGTGKYKSFNETAKAVKASGAEMVTVAVRRVNILDKRKPILTDYLNPKIIYLIPLDVLHLRMLKNLRLARKWEVGNQ